ncbi:Uu.00g119680.m01.CDS01 [Anthostomella pinea]|uniref:chitinase n=1 Tax=Anthostomella pinea TaxID=933095 RepID=A0AAI8YH49_9PEZI|nr:Uu.00g119680.m01.CDS01 [Anthostomella pinea]
MLSHSSYGAALALLASILSTPVAAQLSTKCDPMNATCPADAAFGTSHLFNFNDTQPDGTWNTTAGTVNYDAETGAAFTISEKGDSPTLISNFYFFWGRTEVWLKAAPGQGIISSIVWSSDVLDEVDWEFLGGNTTHASSNYFGKGLQDFHNAGYHLVNGSTQGDYHNYTSVWTADKLEWHIDGALVRTLLPAEANNTYTYPQTPMKLSLGIWAGGDSDQPKGTIEWAGGLTDYDKGPYTMYIKSAAVQDYSTGKEYTYSDMSGSSDSIKITTGNSTAVENINKQPEKSLSEKWDELPSSTKSGIYAAAGGVGAIAFIALAFYYFKQRRSGQKEAALAAARMQEERVELERFQKEGRNPDNLGFDGTEYGGAMNKGGMYGVSSYYAVPDSPPGSSAGPPEKAWDPTSAAVAPGMPLLRNNSFGSQHPQSPGLPPSFPLPQSPVDRGHSTSSASNRMGSPGPTSPPGRGPASPVGYNSNYR